MILKNIASMANKLNRLFMNHINKTILYDIVEGISIIIDSKIHNELLKMTFKYDRINMFKALQRYDRHNYIYSIHIHDFNLIKHIDISNINFISKIDNVTVDIVNHYKIKCKKCNRCKKCEICKKNYIKVSPVVKL